MGENPENPSQRAYLERLKAGTFLIASDELSDPNFHSTIVLICQHSSEGSYGLVLNRTSHMPLSEIFNSIEKNQNSLIKVHLGGPVQESQLQLLHLTESPTEEAIKVSEGVYMGGVWSNVEDIIKPGTEEFLFFLGYSGWGEGQLEYEINRGGWEVHNAKASDVLHAETELEGMEVDDFKIRFL